MIADEAAAHPYGAENYTAYRPTISAGGQYLCLSTANPELGPAGFYYDMWQTASDESADSPYSPVFVPWDARPDRDEEWLKTERAAYTGFDQEFDSYYPDTPAAAFVGRSGLVYEQFNRDRHVVPVTSKEMPTSIVPWDQCIRRVAGVDWGGGDPTAVVMLGMDSKQHIHQYGEFYQRGALGLDEIVGYIQRWDVRGARLSVVVCDPSERFAIETMRSMGIPARKGDNRRGEGIPQVAFLIDHDKLTISPECTNSIKEFAGYRWKKSTDQNSKERYATTTPVDHHADAMDARRYAVLELTAMLRAQPVIRNLSGRPRTSAV